MRTPSFILSIVAILVSLAAATAAHAAASTSTAAIRVLQPNGIWCGVTNVTNKPIDVSVDIVGETGAVQNGGGVLTVAPGATMGNAASAPGIQGFVYCRANGATVKKVHVTTCVVSASTIISGSGECLAETTAP